MSSLTGPDKIILETVFGMDSGYFLNFSDARFEQFFHSYDVNIHGVPYQFYGTSKANKMRAFWDKESDELVGRVLSDLLDVCEVLFSREVLERDSLALKKSREIAARLSGITLEESYLTTLQGRNQETKRISEDQHWEHLWGEGSIRVFISHISQYKNDAMTIKDALEVFGIASFVAHNDIEPSEEWQTEIVRALSSMNLFIALLTEGYKESDWTDQEVGFALARKVPVLPVDRGLTPYGFIGRYQALSWPRSDAFPVARKILEMALKKDELNSYAKIAFFVAVSRASSWARANRFSDILPKIDFLTSDQAEWFVNAYNSNSQVYEAWDFKDRISRELSRMTGNSYKVDDIGRLHLIQQSEDIPF